MNAQPGVGMAGRSAKKSLRLACPAGKQSLQVPVTQPALLHCCGNAKAIMTYLVQFHAVPCRFIRSARRFP
jgi:hypothetical protein